MNDENVWDVHESHAPVKALAGHLFDSEIGNHGETKWADAAFDLSEWNSSTTEGAAPASHAAGSLQNSRLIAALTPDTNLILPYDFEKSQISQTSRDWLSGVLAVQSSVNSQSEPVDFDDIPPLSIDSTRVVWGRLTSVKPKIYRYEGSNIEREVTTILQLWRAKTRSQPSWTSTRKSVLGKKSRVSFGADLFGWDRTPPAQPAERTTKIDPDLTQTTTPSSTATPLVNDLQDDFGEFESAEVQPSIGAIRNDSLYGITLKDVDQALSQERHRTTHASGHIDKSAEPGAASISASNAWDFSLFEKTFSTPLPEAHSPQTVSTPEHHRESRRKKEDERVESVVALLPDLEYLFS